MHIYHTGLSNSHPRNNWGLGEWEAASGQLSLWFCLKLYQFILLQCYLIWKLFAVHEIQYYFKNVTAKINCIDVKKSKMPILFPFICQIQALVNCFLVLFCRAKEECLLKEGETEHGRQGLTVQPCCKVRFYNQLQLMRYSSLLWIITSVCRNHKSNKHEFLF